MCNIAGTDQWLQRGSCLSCEQAWVLGAVDVRAGLYGEFYCAACWDSRDIEAIPDAIGYQDVGYESLTAQEARMVSPFSPGTLMENTFIISESIGVPSRDRSLRFVKSARNDMPGPSTGFSVWLGSRVLLDFMETRLKHSRKATRPCPRVLELGAGCGLPGMGLAQLGADVILTDVPRIVPVLTTNVAINFKSSSVEQNGDCSKTPSVATLRWGHKGDLEEVMQLECSSMGFDYVIGSEIAYDPEANGSLLQTLRDLVSRCGNSYANVGALATSKVGADGNFISPPRRPRIIFAIARRSREIEDFAKHVARARWSFQVLKEVDVSALTGLPSCSTVMVVELKPQEEVWWRRRPIRTARRARAKRPKYSAS